MEDLLKQRLLILTPQVSDSVILEWGSKICITLCLGDADAISQRTHTISEKTQNQIKRLALTSLGYVTVSTCHVLSSAWQSSHKYMYWLNSDNDNTTTLTTYWGFSMYQTVGKPFAHIIIFNPYKKSAKYSHAIDLETKAIKVKFPSTTPQ